MDGIGKGPHLGPNFGQQGERKPLSIRGSSRTVTCIKKKHYCKTWYSQGLLNKTPKYL